MNLLDDVNGFFCELIGRCAFIWIMVICLRRGPNGKTFWKMNLQKENTQGYFVLAKPNYFFLRKQKTGTKTNIVQYITEQDLFNSELHFGPTNMYSCQKSTILARRVSNVHLILSTDTSTLPSKFQDGDILSASYCATLLIPTSVQQFYLQHFPGKLSCTVKLCLTFTHLCVSLC